MTVIGVLADDSPEGERMEDASEVRAFTAPLEETGDGCLAETAKHDPRAFGELYERYHARVYRYVYHRIGSQADAEDVTAAVFMKALEALPSYRSRTNGFAPWLFRITRNAVIDYYRRRRNQSPLEEAEHVTGATDPIVSALRTEQRDELHRLMFHLSTDQREVVLLRYASDLSFTEIAAALNKNEPAIRMLLHRGLRKLKTVIDHE